MNDEIKEILESLDKIAKAEYYPEDLLTYKECQLLLDYITNLQEENERLEKRNKEIYEGFITTTQELCDTTKKYENYKSRCEKAIEYIEDNTYKCYETDYMDLTGIKELKEILGGD